MDNPYSPPSSPLSETDAGASAGPPRTISRWLLGIELVLIAVPATLLLSLYMISFSPMAIMKAAPEDAGMVVALLLAFGGLVGGWTLGLSFVIGGRRSLAARRAWLWWLAACGGIVAFLGLGANYVPAEPYSPLHMFLRDLGMFALGLPLCVPLAHLAFEHWRGRASVAQSTASV